MSRLKKTQEWMQAVVTHPQGVQKGALSTTMDGKLREIESLISPSKSLSSQQRIGIYNSSYFARLLECFQSEYNGLLNALGAELFEHLTWSFLQLYPSTSYTLNKLGELFPTFLKNSLEENLQGESPDWWQLFILDMALYERKYVEVFHGDGHENIISDDVFGVEPLKLSPSVALLELQFPISECIGEFRENETNSFPVQEKTYCVFSRQNYRIKVHTVDFEEWEALQHWIKDPKQKCPEAYAEQWRLKGIGYS